MEYRKSAGFSNTKANQRRFKPCSSQVFKKGHEETNHNFSFKTENPSDFEIKYLSYYREEHNLRKLVGKVKIQSQGVTRTVKNTSLT